LQAVGKTAAGWQGFVRRLALAAGNDHGCAPAGLGRRNDDDTGRRYLGDALYAGPGRARSSSCCCCMAFASSKDEVGNMYAREAKALAEKGIASLRIDFAGFGKARATRLR